MRVEAWLQRAARIAPMATAIEAGGAGVSYAELECAARAGARELSERGARPGERIAIALPPGLAFAQALHATFLLGAIAVPVDLRLTQSEREHIAAGASVLVGEPLAHTPADDRQTRTLVDAPPGRIPPDASFARVSTDPAPPNMTQEDGKLDARAWDTTHDLAAVCAVIHTSGTTSSPRPIELTYGNFLWSAIGSGVALGVDPGERWLCALPLSHVGGLSILIRSAIYATAAVIHERFETERALAALREDRITLVSLVATTLARLLDAGLREPPHLRCALTGGGPVPAALVESARAAGVPVLETYGLTECCSQAATAPLAALQATMEGGRAASPFAGVAQGPPLRVSLAAEPTAEPTAGPAAGPAAEPTAAPTAEPTVEPAAEPVTEPTAAPTSEPAVEPAPDLGAGVPLFCTRTEIAPDGEILLSGPTVASSARAPDGRLHTGDLGRIDEQGFLHVTGRKADTIVSGGENVAPSEVEAVLESCPGVLEAAVVGRPDEQWGEAVNAIVVVAPGATLSETAVRAHCASTLAQFKVPKHVSFVSAPLPRTASGKLLRREL